ncbi:MAG: metallophosphoesterase family protein [Acidobacteriota bacterium]
MLIGVLSDSHGRLERLAEAAGIFASRGVNTLIHCGDITTVEAVEALAAFEVHWVFGNCDWNENSLRAAMTGLGHRCHGIRGELEIGGCRLGFTHGHRFDLYQAMVSSGEYDLVFHGHTHVRRDEMEHGTRVICPSALHHAAPPGFLVLTLSELKTEWVDLVG